MDLYAKLDSISREASVLGKGWKIASGPPTEHFNDLRAESAEYEESFIEVKFDRMSIKHRVMKQGAALIVLIPTSGGFPPWRRDGKQNIHSWCEALTKIRSYPIPIAIAFDDDLALPYQELEVLGKHGILVIKEHTPVGIFKNAESRALSYEAYFQTLLNNETSEMDLEP